MFMLSSCVHSFTVNKSRINSTPTQITSTGAKSHRSSTQTQMTVDDTIISSIQSTSTYLSTISADIDNIPTDEFGKVFAGGIVVMIGGVFSALMVGFLLESNNSYASVVADSYAQGGDEEFWDSLSPEDQVKAKELIAKLKASKEGRGSGGDELSIGGTSSNDVLSEVQKMKSEGGDDKKQSEKKSGEAAAVSVSMFSDYED